MIKNVLNKRIYISMFLVGLLLLTSLSSTVCAADVTNYVFNEKVSITETNKGYILSYHIFAINNFKSHKFSANRKFMAFYFYNIVYPQALGFSVDFEINFRFCTS